MKFMNRKYKYNLFLLLTLFKYSLNITTIMLGLCHTCLKQYLLNASPSPPGWLIKKKMHLLNFWDVYSSGMFNWENSNLDLIEEF